MNQAPRLAIIGGTGCGGRAIAGHFRRLGIPVLTLAQGRTQPLPDCLCERHDPKLASFLADFRPEVVVDHSAYTAAEVERALAALPDTTERYVLISSVVVYGPARAAPYQETDPPAPVGALAQDKLAAERVALASDRSVLCLRLGALFGPGHAPITPWGRDKTLPEMLRRAEPIPIPTDDSTSGLQPWFSGDHARYIEHLLFGAYDTAQRILNLATPAVSWREHFSTWATAVSAPSPTFVTRSRAELMTLASERMRPFLPTILDPPRMSLGRMQAVWPEFEPTPLLEGIGLTAEALYEGS